jgi:hypothetical protein
LTDEVIAYVNVFGSGMKLPWFSVSESDGSLIVAIDSDGIREWSEKFSDELIDPRGFFGSVS